MRVLKKTRTDLFIVFKGQFTFFISERESNKDAKMGCIILNNRKIWVRKEDR